MATVLPMSAKTILKYLNPKHKAFQVQFGAGGSDLTKNQYKKNQSHDYLENSPHRKAVAVGFGFL